MTRLLLKAPRQRNSTEENKAIKKGEIPEDWKKDDEKTKHKVCQKDTDARWTKKRGETYYGYKNHVKVDADSKVITDYSVTDAAVHDSKRFLGFINEGEDKNVYADSAYRSKELEEKVKEMGIEYSVCERIYRNKPLTEEQKERNKKLSRVRSRVEHENRFYERGKVQHWAFESCVQYGQVFSSDCRISAPATRGACRKRRQKGAFKPQNSSLFAPKTLNPFVCYDNF